MKKQLSLLSMLVVILTGIALMAFNFQQKGNGKNDKPEKQGRQNQKQPGQGKQDKKVAMNPGPGNGKGKGDDRKHNNGNGDGHKGKGNNNGIAAMSPDDKPGNGRNGRIKLPGNDNNWYGWTRENFKDRSQVRNKGKVTICHKFRSNDEPVNITVSENALKAHLGHGDVTGACPAVNNAVFSDIFRKRRTSYYNDVYYGQDQYNYSSSILDYALMRLTNSRSELNLMRINNAPLADIERRQASVVQLEENVSVLETLLGAAGQLLADRL